MSDLLLEISKKKSYITKVKGKTALEIKNCFFSNYLTALLFIKTKDLRTIKHLLDSKNEKLTSLTNDMSDINYWFRCLFLSQKDLMLKAAISAQEHDILKLQVNDTIKDKSLELLLALQKPEEMIDWNKLATLLALIAYKINFNSSHLDTVLPILVNWDTSSESKKNLCFAKCFEFLMLAQEEKSFYLKRLRAVSTKFILNTGKDKFRGIKVIKEDEAISVGEIGNIQNGISDAVLARIGLVSKTEKEDITDIQLGNKKIRKLGNKIVKKRKKVFKPSLFKQTKPITQEL